MFFYKTIFAPNFCSDLAREIDFLETSVVVVKRVYDDGTQAIQQGSRFHCRRLCTNTSQETYTYPQRE